MEMNQLHVDVSMKINDHLDYVAKRAGAPPPLDPPSGYDGGSAYGKVYHTPVPPLLSNQVDHHDGNEILTIYQGNGARRLPLATVKGYLPHH